ncbi:sensor histidine kinase [Rhodoligotrophos defluvii]|uniref:sensor histidine kinase n=1 Tax=Rhodoligotrophos defluvii TaxID=2561934 RepID=UPI0010C9FF4A|nr:histidine kinase [Rhodoligotrophos defluvii]
MDTASREGNARKQEPGAVPRFEEKRKSSGWHKGLAWLGGAWRASVIDLLFASHYERLIGFGRLSFAAFAAIAIYLDPTQPTRNIEETYLILAAYFVYSAVLSVISISGKFGFRWEALIHAVDIGTICVLVHFTDGLMSPFFAFFGFALLTATMRWGWRGALATAFILEISLVGISWLNGPPSQQADPQLNIVIMRSASLFVTAAMLGYFCAYRERTRYRLAKLAAWPLDCDAQLDGAPLARALRHAAQVLGGARVAVVWQKRGEPAGRSAQWSSAGFQFSHLPNPPNLNRLRQADTCSAQFASANFVGLVAVSGARVDTEDVVSLTEIVAARIASELEHAALSTQIATAASAQERIRLARDMHDSVLQNLTAASLQLKGLAAQLEGEGRHRVQMISQLILGQQRTIRHYVEEATRSRELSDHPVGASEQIRNFAQALGEQWRCQIDVRIEPIDIQMSNTMLSEICLLISEATANAVRHGNATKISLTVTRGSSSLRISLRDNGRGLGGKEVNGHGLEPQSLKSRVARLGGQLAFRTCSPGAELSIAVPL